MRKIIGAFVVVVSCNAEIWLFIGSSGNIKASGGARGFTCEKIMAN